MSVLQNIGRYASPSTLLGVGAVGGTALATGAMAFPGVALGVGLLGAGATAGYKVANYFKSSGDIGNRVKPDRIQEAIYDATGIDMASVPTAAQIIPSDVYNATSTVKNPFLPQTSQQPFVLTTASGDAAAAKALSGLRHLQTRLGREYAVAGIQPSFSNYLSSENDSVIPTLAGNATDQFFESIKRQHGLLGITMVGIGGSAALGTGVALLTSNMKTMSTVAKVILGILLAASIGVVIFGIIQLTRGDDKKKDETTTSWGDENVQAFETTLLPQRPSFINRLSSDENLFRP